MDNRPSTVLIVDDTEENTDILSYLVESMNHKAVVALNGRQALACLEAEDIDLVLLDIMMPDISGMDVLAHIREHRDLQELPVILLSALSEVSHIIGGIEAGANEYITKPFNTKVVKVRVDNQLRVKRLWDERQKMLNALQHANAMKNHLMRIASHDLKNPVSNLNMILNLLEPAIVSTPENDDLVNMAYRYTEAMNTIISEFLELDILRDEVIEIHASAVRLDEITLDIVKDYQHSAGKKGIVIQADLHEAVVLADEKRLRQVIANLLSNAVKYSPQGSTVHLITQVEGASVYLHVLDEGDGIPRDELETLFQPFGKLSNQPTGGEHSTGLGLWIVKQMIEAMDGEVGLNIEYESGADFWIRLPKVN